jgi:Co/Zn/Cd efflux system component
MAHHRKAVAAAVAVNAAIVAVELAAGWRAGSLSLAMDGGNLSDELALVLLYLAFVLPQGLSRNLLGWVAVVVGLGAALANWVIARLLWPPSRGNAAIRLAYLHNLADAFASLAPVLAGVRVSVSGRSFFDPLVAGGIAVWIIVSTLREVLVSRDELISPEKLVCGHAEPD